ncbi:MAG: hypothetical protein ACE5HP_07985 [Gemmatimonadota bacterium]
MNAKGAAGISTGLALAAVLVTLGFLVWLYQRSSSLEQRVTPVLEDARTGEPDLGLEEFRLDPSAAVGRRVGLETVPVATRLGRASFTLQLDDALAYPALLSPDLIKRRAEVYGGDIISVWGNVYALNDSIRGEWIRAGAVDEANAGLIPGSTSFVLVDSMRIR